MMTLILVLVSVSSILRLYRLVETRSYNTMAKMGYQIAPEHRLEFMGNYYRSLQDSQYVGTTGDFGHSPAIGIPSDTVINGGTPYNKAFHLKYDGQYGKTAASLSLYYEDMNTVFETFILGTIIIIGLVYFSQALFAQTPKGSISESLTM